MLIKIFLNKYQIYTKENLNITSPNNNQKNNKNNKINLNINNKNIK